MSDDDLELDADLGRATIVYEDPEEGTTELTVDNEHVAYFQDHWTVKTGEDDQGNDVIRRIPTRRVHYVERSVEEFAEEIRTLRTQVQSFAEGLRSKLPVGGDGEDDRDDGAEPLDLAVSDASGGGDTNGGGGDSSVDGEDSSVDEEDSSVDDGA